MRFIFQHSPPTHTLCAVHTFLRVYRLNWSKELSRADMMSWYELFSLLLYDRCFNFFFKLIDFLFFINILNKNSKPDQFCQKDRLIPYQWMPVCLTCLLYSCLDSYVLCMFWLRCSTCLFSHIQYKAASASDWLHSKEPILQISRLIP